MKPAADLSELADEGRRLLQEAIETARMTLKNGDVLTPGHPAWDTVFRAAQWFAGHSAKKPRFLEKPEDLNLKPTAR